MSVWRQRVGRALIWLGYGWIGALFAFHFIGELLAPSDSFTMATTPLRFFVIILLCIPGFALVLSGQGLSRPSRDT